MKADLKKRLERIESSFGAPTILGLWAYADDGSPTYHHLMGESLDLARWFKTGELPKGTEFCFVMASHESERLWTPEPERQQPYGFTASPEQLEEPWEPFPKLHPKTLAQFEKMRQMDVYHFIDGQFRGVHGPLPPHEQRRELYPHGY